MRDRAQVVAVVVVRHERDVHGGDGGGGGIVGKIEQDIGRHLRRLRMSLAGVGKADMRVGGFAPVACLLQDLAQLNDRFRSHGSRTSSSSGFWSAGRITTGSGMVIHSRSNVLCNRASADS